MVLNQRSILIVLIFVLINCVNEPSTPIFEEQIIINAYLYVGQGVDSVYISRTLKINEQYTYDKAAVIGADVMLSVDNQSYQLYEYSNKPGAYFLPADSLIVTPGKEYFLKIESENKIIQASTKAPNPVKINRISTDTTEHLGPQFELFWDKVANAAGYIISTKAKSTKELVDLGAIGEHRLEMVDYDTLKAFPNVVNFPATDLDTLFQLPWFMFWYYGEYTVKLYAIDQNLLDLATSPSIYQPQSSEFEQPIYHINGGIGILAAVSVDSLIVYVNKPDQ